MEDIIDKKKNQMKEYQGKASEYISKYIIPSLPNVENVIALTESLYFYLSNVSNIRYVRKLSSYKNRGTVFNVLEKSFTVTDNEPAIWFYMECFESKIREFGFVEENNMFPIAFALTKEEKRSFENKFNYGKQKREKTFSAKNLKHCHILDCSPRNTSVKTLSIDQRMLRLISPMNHFPFPSKRKYDMVRDYGEDSNFQSLIKKILYKEYYKTEQQKRSFLKFLNASGDNFIIDDDLFDLDISFKLGIDKSNLKRRKATKAKKNRNLTHNNTINKNYFIISEAYYGQGMKFEIEFIKGANTDYTYVYIHDEVYDNALSHLKTLSCWINEGKYTSSKNIPKWAIDCVETI